LEVQFILSVYYCNRLSLRFWTCMMKLIADQIVEGVTIVRVLRANMDVNISFNVTYWRLR